MTNFVRANKLTIVDLNSISSIVHDPSGFSSVSGHTKVIQLNLKGGGVIAVNESDEQYQWWLKYMERQQSMCSSILAEIRNENFNPFLDEMAATLYSVFQSLPASEDLVLSLMADGQGGVWHGNTATQTKENALVHWRDMESALDALMAFRAHMAGE